MPDKTIKSLGVLTSGGDAPGMNAAVRGVVRTALDKGIAVYAIYEGYQGMVDGGEQIRKMDWCSVSSIMQRGGTVIGTARCPAFRERAGRLQAARNLLAHDINSLIVIGGDGSLTGANLFRQEWPELVAELEKTGEISSTKASQNSNLAIVGVVGSIDNDMFGTDMTVGADTALHRITEAIDAITSTADSHQRTFVVEVMGRNCGYLALMGGLAGAADWVLIPESPPRAEDWEQAMCQALHEGREAGRRDSIVVIAEGACDRHGNPISSDYVKQVLEERLNLDVRITILGHVQRGGAPSAFDRFMSTLMGYAAVEELLATDNEEEPFLIGMRSNRISRAPLMECVAKTHAVAKTIADGEYEQAMDLRGGSFKEALNTFRTLVRALPRPPEPGQRRFRLAVLNAGGPAPGMNTASRAAIRLGLDQGHIMLGVQNGFQGLIKDNIREMHWMTVAGWASMGGAELGTTRTVPDRRHFYSIARTMEKEQIDGLLVIGGWDAYEATYRLSQERENFAAFNIPMICLPASIDNNLPGSELSIGADTALNSIVEVIDKIKQSAVATRRVFVLEIMGQYCGYLSLMANLAVGAEQVYLSEEGVALKDLQRDVENLIKDFKSGRRLGLMVRNERCNPIYTTDVMAALFRQEGEGIFEVRQAILGHLQQGGNPTPFDRIQATRLATLCIEFLIDRATREQNEVAFIGLHNGKTRIQNLEDFPRIVDWQHSRPKQQWWLELLPVARLLAQSQPNTAEILADDIQGDN